MNIIEKLRNGFRKEDSVDMDIKSADGRWNVKGMPASVRKAFEKAKFARLDDVALEDRIDGADGPMPIYIVSIEVNPEMAQYYLDHNENNFRGLDEKRAKKIAVDIKNSKFTINNDMMVVWPGHLNVNAQHRLRAIVESGVSAPMTIMYGMIYDKNIDGGKKREYRDYLKDIEVRNFREVATAMPEIMRQIGHFTKTGLMFEEYPNGFESYETVRASFPDISDTIDEFTAIEKYEGMTLSNSGKVAGLYAVLKTVDPDMAMKSIKMLYKHPEVAMETPECVRLMVNKIRKSRNNYAEKKSTNRPDRRVPTSALVNIFNHLVCGKAIPKERGGNPAPIGIASAMLRIGVVSKAHLDINPKLYDLLIAGVIKNDEVSLCEELIMSGIDNKIESMETFHKKISMPHSESAVRRIAKKLVSEGILEMGRSNAGTHFYSSHDMAYGRSGFFKDVKFSDLGAVSAVSGSDDQEEDEEIGQTDLF